MVTSSACHHLHPCCCTYLACVCLNYFVSRLTHCLCWFSMKAGLFSFPSEIAGRRLLASRPNPLRPPDVSATKPVSLLAERHSFADKPSPCKNRPAKWRTSRLAGRSASGDRRRRRWGAPMGPRSDVTARDPSRPVTDVTVRRTSGRCPSVSLWVRARKWRIRCDMTDSLPPCRSCSPSSPYDLLRTTALRVDDCIGNSNSDLHVAAPSPVFSCM